MTPQKWLLLLATEARELTARQRQQIVAQTRRTEQVIGRKFRNAMRKFFVGQARRVTKGYMDAGGYLSAHADGEYKDPASQLLGVNEDTAIVAASRPYVLEMTVAAINAASDLVGAPRVAAAKALKEQPDILGTDPTVLFLTDQSAQRVVQVNDATRRGVQRTIVKGAAAGYSDYEIAYGSTRTRKDGYRPLKGMVERLYRGRPECIARTELAYSNNGASLHRYSQWGQDMVEVSDGPGCALTHHVQGLRPGESSSDDINGQKIAVKEANNWQVAHPNCRRVFLPLRQVRKPTTPPMEREAFITRPLTAAQRARVAREMALTRVTAPPKPPAPPQVIDEVVPTPAPATGFVEQASVHEAEQWAKDVGLANTVDYTGLDVAAANQWNRGMFDMIKGYKAAPLESVTTGGTKYVADAHGTKAGGRIRINKNWNQKETLAQSRRDNIKAIKETHEMNVREIPVLREAIEELEKQKKAGAWGDKDSYAYFEKNDDLRLFKGRLKKAELDQNVTEFVVDGIEPVYDVAVHETAHVFQWRYPGWSDAAKKPAIGWDDTRLVRLLGGPKNYKGGGYATAKVSAANKAEVLKLSRYAATNTLEVFAESVVAYNAGLTNRMTPGMIEAVKDVLKQVPKWKTGMGPTERWEAGK
jgi:hypothetical protein